MKRAVNLDSGLSEFTKNAREVAEWQEGDSQNHMVGVIHQNQTSIQYDLILSVGVLKTFHKYNILKHF